MSLCNCVRLPIDWKTPSGYLVAFFCQCFGVLTATLIILQFLNLVFGSCWLFIHIAKDITRDLVAFNDDIESPNQNRVELTTRFNDLVQIYTDAKQ